ncbi:MAG: HAMP domain-containing histidine kinase, partial [Methylococcales bacterium]|nr:HAMP domain-containing histidine kinase [Methylococcales bacterium]
DHQSVPEHIHALSDEHFFNLHIFGMWFGFVFSAGLVAYFAVELANTIRERERKLAEARENALRDERVVSLGTLAASAAHDMGTPLGTIAIIAHEMESEYPEHRFPDLHEKMQILQEQVTRCKNALSVMSATAGELRAESGEIMPVTDYIDEVLNQWRTQQPSVKLCLFVDHEFITQARIVAEQTLTHSLINILNNAAVMSPKEKGVEFHIKLSSETAHLKIRDFGPGIPDKIINYVGKHPVSSNKSGLGVGLFLAYTTIKRLGGKIDTYNMETGGACIEIALPLLADEERHE